jgi:hypothetical protein
VGGASASKAAEDNPDRPGRSTRSGAGASRCGGQSHRSTPAADHLRTSSGYTHRTLNRPTTNPVVRTPTTSGNETLLSSMLYWVLLSPDAALIRCAIWFRAIRSI